MANLLVGLPTVALNSTVTALAATGNPTSNLFGGNRTDFYRTPTAGSGIAQIAFAGATAIPANFVYMAGARRFLASGTFLGFNVRHNTINDYASGTDVTLSTALSSGALVGTHGEDYIATFTSVTRQFWWVNHNLVTSVRPMEKLFLGAAFDMDRDPDEDGGIVITRTRTVGSQRRAGYTFDVKWTGVSYAKAVEFYRTFVLTRRHQPLILFTTTYHAVLNDARVVLCRLTRASNPPTQTGQCDVSATFEEMI